MSSLGSAVLTGALSTAVVAAILWLMTRAEQEREREGRSALRHAMSSWAARRQWAVTEKPDPAIPGSVPPGPGHQVLAAAEGELDGRQAALMLCTDEYEDGVPIFAMVVLRSPEPFPALEVRQRSHLARSRRARNPALPGPSADDDGDFDRRFEIGSATGAAGAALLTGPVRDALARLSVLGADGRHFVDLRDGTLSVLIAGRPPRLDLDLLVGTVADLAAALRVALDPLPGETPRGETPPWETPPWETLP